ncbi:MAG TPA: ATPase domain-containing protein [Phycisphaerales bacterium]|nr:ATPase domain-containing protein [Phycisphaerales bacterium]
MTDSLISTGIPGLDHILRGGLPTNRLYLLQGDPGVGKTTLALQFLLEGVRRGERGLYVTFSETRAEVEGIARSHGWSLDGLEFFEFEALQKALEGERAGTVFHPSETELAAVSKSLWEAMDRAKPKRMVFDSLSELRLLAGDPLRYRRQLLEIKRRAAAHDCAAILVDDRTATRDDLQLQSLAHGVISLHRTTSGYGTAKRRLEVVKLRGVGFRNGWHDFAIETGGVVVYPRLVASEYAQREGGMLKSGVAELDQLLGGGIDLGASTLLLGPAGAGKSTVAMKYAVAAAERGEKSLIFMFEESASMLRARAKGVGLDLAPHEANGNISLRTVDAADVSPGQFAFNLRRAVEEQSARLIVIDSLNGYLNAMPDEKHLALHLHELLAYAAARGIAVLMVISQQGMMGPWMQQPVDASYLADTVLLFRYYEYAGEIRKAVSVAKRRGGSHEHSIRSLTIGAPDGIKLGPPLSEFRGVLTGVPVYTGTNPEKV